MRVIAAGLYDDDMSCVILCRVELRCVALLCIILCPNHSPLRPVFHVSTMTCCAIGAWRSREERTQAEAGRAEPKNESRR